MVFQSSRLPEIRHNETRVDNQRKCPLNRLSIVMSQIGEKSFDTGDGEQNAAENIEILDTDEVVDCFGRIEGAEDSRVIGCDVDNPGDEESGKPK